MIRAEKTAILAKVVEATNLKVFKNQAWENQAKALMRSALERTMHDMLRRREIEAMVEFEMLIDKNGDLDIVVPGPTWQDVLVEMTRAQSALNQPTPEECPPDMVRDAHDHLSKAFEIASEIVNG